MLKYKLLKLTFQGVLRIMILLFFYCTVFNLKSKRLFNCRQNMNIFREYITCVTFLTISMLPDILFS